MTISTKTAMAKLAVIGWPVAHSLSPTIHRHWFQRLGIAATYDAVPVALDDLEGFIKTLPENGYRGINITLPHKERALALATDADPAAKKIGAANTIVVGDDGSLLATNTDADGFILALGEFAPDWRPDAGPALVVGAGGVARAICYALLVAGAVEVRLSNRSDDRAMALAGGFGAMFGSDKIRAVDWSGRNEAATDAALLVNATSAGLEGPIGDIFPLEAIPEGGIVFDAGYGTAETEVVENALKRGLRATSGLGMLCHQAALAFELWFGIRPPVDNALKVAITDEIAVRQQGIKEE